MNKYMVFIAGENKIVNIGLIPGWGGNNGLEMILRESGRFIIRGDGEFIALSEKKTRPITISGTIAASSSAEHFNQYDDQPGNVEYGSGEIFPQDLLNEYNVEQMEIYGISSLLKLALTAEPSDAVARLLGAHIKYWISRQPLSSWNPEDCIGIIISAYQTVPIKGMQEITEGVTVSTTKVRQIPVFSPIKSSFDVRKLKDKLYLYSSIDIMGYCDASTAGGAVTGSATLDTRFIIGQGFLPEEVEELLSPSQ